MSWATEAFNALKKIILLEERVGQLADRDERRLAGITACQPRQIRRAPSAGIPALREEPVSPGAAGPDPPLVEVFSQAPENC
jgi:hypothetical protein